MTLLHHHKLQTLSVKGGLPSHQAECALCLQAAAQAQAIRDARKEKAKMEGNVNDMENAQDFLKAGNVKVGAGQMNTMCKHYALVQWHSIRDEDRTRPVGT